MSKLQAEVDLMRSIPMLANLPASKLKLLAFASDRVTYEPGEVLFNQGDEADAAYIVIDGLADVVVSADGDGPGSVVAELGPNSFVGDMAIVADIPRTATVRASKKLDALRIRRDHLMDLIRDTPDLAMEVLRELVDRLAKTTHDLSEAKAEIARLSG